jgi:GNAT superfamily N-acetyltransferase
MTPNRPTISDIKAALLRAPNFLASLGLDEELVAILDRSKLGEGHYASAFLLPSGVVLKVTDDEDDARVCKLILDHGQGEPGLPYIDAVYRLPGDVYSNETEPSQHRPLFAIVMEPVTLASKTGMSRTLAGTRGRILGEAARYPSEEVWLPTDEAVRFARKIRKGIQWLSAHGVDVVDLHHNNLGYASGKRPVIIDFGHGSIKDEFIMKPIEMAMNAAQKPTERQALTIWRALGSPTVSMDELRMGIEVEQEHTGDMREAGKIAMDHLREFPDYYTRLTKMEARAKAGLAPNEQIRVEHDLGQHRELGNWGPYVLVSAYIGSQEAGRLWFQWNELTIDKPVVDVARVLVDPSFRRSGVSTALHRAAAGWLRERGKRLGSGWVVGDENTSYWKKLEASGEARRAGDGWELMKNGRPMPKVRAAFDECFDALVEQFPDFGDLELHHDEKAGGDNGHGSERQFGYCMDSKPIRVAFAAKTEDLPVANIHGLMAHEFGHALDYRYGDELGKMLGQRLPAGVERRADAIAKAVFGRTIRYDDRDIQCVACQGKSVRPRRLG